MENRKPEMKSMGKTGTAGLAAAANAAGARPEAVVVTAPVAATLAYEAGLADARNEEEEKRRKRRLILIIFIALALALLLMYTLGVFDNQPPRAIVAGDLFPDEGDVDDGYLDNMSQEDIMAQMQKVADASYFSFKINARPVFENGSAEGDLGIENPNYNVYPMVVQIFLDDTEELIYDSGGILPDKHISKAKLLRALPKGTHKATAYMNAYDPKTKEWRGKQAAGLEIVVEN